MKWLLLRRFSQLLVITLFATGPYFGFWILKGNLSSSLLLETVPFADPLLVLQSVATGYVPEMQMLLGALLVAVVYAVIGGRVFCSWVCPVNLVTDAAYWARRRLGLKKASHFPRQFRYVLLALVLVLPLLSGYLVWEWINPVSLAMRGIVFGIGAGVLILLALFLFDLLVLERGWCGHICPVGAGYALLGRLSPLKMSAPERDKCNRCMDCFRVCPEPQVLKMPLAGALNKKATHTVGPQVTSNDCTKCGRCIDVCDRSVFRFTLKTDNQVENN